MRVLLICLTCILSLLIGGSSSAVTMDWTPIGNPGNACDPQPVSPEGMPAGCFGTVSYSYSIGTHEVTNAQYAEFLNAKAASDPYLLYSFRMGDPTSNRQGRGGIARSGSPGSYAYSAFAGRENMPVNYVTFYDALRFANWMNNGQGTGDTETGAYTLLGGTATPSNGLTVTRNAGAMIALTSEDEWYKAAYHSPTGAYFDYPAGSDTPTTCATTPTAAANSANCANDPDEFASDVTPVGSFTGSPSPYGTFDQGGNVWEWNETIVYDEFRKLRGGSFDSLSFFHSPSYWLAAARPGLEDPSKQYTSVGFRLVLIPEPSTGLLVSAGLVGLAARRKIRH